MENGARCVAIKIKCCTTLAARYLGSTNGLFATQLLLQLSIILQIPKFIKLATTIFNIKSKNQAYFEMPSEQRFLAVFLKTQRAKRLCRIALFLQL